MRKNNGKDARRGSPIKGTLAGLLIAVLLFPGNVPAAKKKSGHTLTLTLKTGGVAKGELLAVKDDRLVIFDANSLSGKEVRIGDVAQIRVQKKAKFFKLLGLGILIGGASGALVGLLSGDDPDGWFSYTAGEKAGLGAVLGGGLGAIAGGIGGALKGIDESMNCGSLSPPALIQLFGKLKKYARDSREVPAAVGIIPAPISAEGAKPAEVGATPGLAENSGQAPGRPIPPGKYSRFHLSLAPGYFRSSGVSQLGNLIRDIGFAGSKSLGDWFGSGATIIEYPHVMKDPVLLIKDIGVEYSLSREFALGLAYAPLGEHTVSGWRVIPGKDYRPDTFPQTQFVGSYRGRIFFLTASYFPVPDAFLKKTSVKLSAGIGYGKMAMDYYGCTYDTSYQDTSPDQGVDRKSFTKSGAGALLVAELMHFFNPQWSLGISADYKYVPLRCGGYAIDCPYWYYAYHGGPMQFDALTVDVASRTYNLGGWRIGLLFGFHF
ncbi:MAG TPA: hypothetical protein VMZ49_01900 [Patescibacteria group bacterium]|nr:hypothetical protein [Patescibacteria group bacterium]